MKATGWKGKAKIRNSIDELLTKVNMLEKGDKFPHQLSGGEQQRIAIARALINNPDLIIADEPTGNLDPQTSEEIISLLFEICKNEKTIVRYEQADSPEWPRRRQQRQRSTRSHPKIGTAARH